MPSFPLVDTHLHLWDPGRLSYSWQGKNPLLQRPYRVEDYCRDSQGLEIEALVFIECYADFDSSSGQYLEEIEFVEEEAQREPRLKAIVPMVPLERGRSAGPLLEKIVTRFPKVRGIRRIVEFDADPRRLMLSPSFIDGVNLLEQFDLHFEINVNYTQMDIVREFVTRVPNVPMILDHCGKPGIRGGHIGLFRRQMTDLAHHPNVFCKLSDLAVEADWQKWTDGDLRPFIDATIGAFGVDRVMFGGDWPVCLQATSLLRWVEVVDRALQDLTATERRKVYRDNANRFYRLGLSP